MKVFLAMESDGLGLHLTLLDIDLVAAKDDWDLFADTDKVTYQKISRMPWIPVAENVRCQLGTFL